MTPTREERIVCAAFDLASKLDGSWGLALCLSDAGYEPSLYGDLVLFGSRGEALRISPVKQRRPWAYTLEPVLPYDEDKFSTGWATSGEYVHRRLNYPSGWFFPKEHRPRPVLVETRTPTREIAHRLEEDVLPTYRRWVERIQTRNVARRERLARERAFTVGIAHAFGGPVCVMPKTHNVARCTLVDGRSTIDLHTHSPHVEMSFFVPRDHAVAVAEKLADLLGFISS